MRILALILLSLSPAIAAAATFRTQLGQSFDAEVAGVYGDIVLLKSKRGTTTMDIDSLDDASLVHLATFLTKQTPPKPWATSDSRLAKALGKRLQVLRDGKLVPFDRGSRPEPEFYLIYFSAHWCGPCRRFSPELLKTYHALKAVSPERFEIIFVSDDRDSAEQLTYVRELPMPWPVVPLGTSVSALDQWSGPGIPCLVVLTRENDLLFHSYAGAEYLGPDNPLRKFEALLNHLVENRPSRGRHRLAVAAHVLGASAGQRAPLPYLVSIDPRRNRTLPDTPIHARVRINEKGRVLSAEFTPALELVAENQLQAETEEWLFLPAVKDGRPIDAVVEFPIQRNK